MSPLDYDENQTVTFKYQQSIPAITPIQKAANAHTLPK
jgi:hypothetical protein